ncbi:MAG: dephospho-CoA kinase, partial [Bacteroidota bacterium]
RAYLAKGIFSNPSLRQQINDIVHPAVAHDFTTWFSLQSDIPYVLQESALLIEIGAKDRFDKMIVVDAPLDVRIQRIMDRDDATAHQVRERIQSQLQASEKLQHANFVISNDGRGVIRQVLDIHLELSKHVQKADR